MSGTATLNTISTTVHDGCLIQGALNIPSSIFNIAVGPGLSNTLDGATISQGFARTQEAQMGSSGDLSISGTVTISSDAVFSQDSDSNLVGSGTLNLRGAYNWYGGQMNGSTELHVFANAVLRIGQGAAPDIPLAMINGWTLYNEGTVTWFGFDITVGADLQPNPTWTNYGIFDVRIDRSVINSNGEAPTFYNYGTLRKTAGNGTAAFEMGLFNYGTVGPITGTLRFWNGVYQRGGQALIQPQGGILIADGGFEQDDGSTILQTGDALQVNGQCLFAGGSASLGGGTITATLGMQMQSSASLSGSGNIVANVSNAGTFVTGAADGSSPGTIGVTGNYTQTAGSTTVYGELDVSGTFQVTGGTVLVPEDQNVFNVNTIVQSGGDIQIYFTDACSVANDYTMTGGTAEFYYSGGTIGGQMALNGGVFQLNSATTLTISNGISIGTGGTLQFFGGTIAANITNAGTLSLDVVLGQSAFHIGTRIDKDVSIRVPTLSRAELSALMHGPVEADRLRGRGLRFPSGRRAARMRPRPRCTPPSEATGVRPSPRSRCCSAERRRQPPRSHSLSRTRPGPVRARPRGATRP
jgi:hypothetical protein